MSKNPISPASLMSQVPVAQLFDDMAQQISQLAGMWTIYKRLFCFDQATVDLLNASAPAFFFFARSWLQNDIIMAVCRLLDPVQSATGQSNLSVEAVIRKAFPSPCQQQFLSRLAHLRSQAEPLRQQRNKRLAHADQAVRLAHDSKDADITVGLLDQIVAELLALRRDIYRQLRPDHDYQSGATALAHHAEELLACLERARNQASAA